MSREPRTLHGDLCRNGWIVGSWSAKSPDVMAAAVAVWDCHVTLDGHTEHFHVRVSAIARDMEIMLAVINRGQIAHMVRRSVRTATEKEEKDD